jgi:hypothetical protein
MFMSEVALRRFNTQAYCIDAAGPGSHGWTAHPDLERAYSIYLFKIWGMRADDARDHKFKITDIGA